MTEIKQADMLDSVSKGEATIVDWEDIWGKT